MLAPVIPGRVRLESGIEAATLAERTWLRRGGRPGEHVACFLFYEFKEKETIISPCAEVKRSTGE